MKNWFKIKDENGNQVRGFYNTVNDAWNEALKLGLKNFAIYCVPR